MECTFSKSISKRKRNKDELNTTPLPIFECFHCASEKVSFSIISNNIITDKYLYGCSPFDYFRITEILNSKLLVENSINNSNISFIKNKIFSDENNMSFSFRNNFGEIDKETKIMIKTIIDNTEYLKAEYKYEVSCHLLKTINVDFTPKPTLKFIVMLKMNRETKDTHLLFNSIYRQNTQELNDFLKKELFSYSQSTTKNNLQSRVLANKENTNTEFDINNDSQYSEDDVKKESNTHNSFVKEDIEGEEGDGSFLNFLKFEVPRKIKKEEVKFENNFIEIYDEFERDNEREIWLNDFKLAKANIKQNYIHYPNTHLIKENDIDNLNLLSNQISQNLSFNKINSNIASAQGGLNDIINYSEITEKDDSQSTENCDKLRKINHDAFPRNSAFMKKKLKEKYSIKPNIKKFSENLGKKNVLKFNSLNVSKKLSNPKLIGNEILNVKDNLNHLNVTNISKASKKEKESNSENDQKTYMKTRFEVKFPFNSSKNNINSEKNETLKLNNTDFFTETNNSNEIDDISTIKILENQKVNNSETNNNDILNKKEIKNIKKNQINHINNSNHKSYNFINNKDLSYQIARKIINKNHAKKENIEPMVKLKYLENSNILKKIKSTLFSESKKDNDNNNIVGGKKGNAFELDDKNSVSINSFKFNNNLKINSDNVNANKNKKEDKIINNINTAELLTKSLQNSNEAKINNDSKIKFENMIQISKYNILDIKKQKKLEIKNNTDDMLNDRIYTKPLPNFNDLNILLNNCNFSSTSKNNQKSIKKNNEKSKEKEKDKDKKDDKLPTNKNKLDINADKLINKNKKHKQFSLPLSMIIKMRNLNRSSNFLNKNNEKIELVNNKDINCDNNDNTSIKSEIQIKQVNNISIQNLDEKKNELSFEKKNSNFMIHSDLNIDLKNENLLHNIPDINKTNKSIPFQTENTLENLNLSNIKKKTYNKKSVKKLNIQKQLNLNLNLKENKPVDENLLEQSFDSTSLKSDFNFNAKELYNKLGLSFIDDNSLSNDFSGLISKVKMEPTKISLKKYLKVKNQINMSNVSIFKLIQDANLNNISAIGNKSKICHKNSFNQSFSITMNRYQLNNKYFLNQELNKSIQTDNKANKSLIFSDFIDLNNTVCNRTFEINKDIDKSFDLKLKNQMSKSKSFANKNVIKYEGEVFSDKITKFESNNAIQFNNNFFEDANNNSINKKSNKNKIDGCNISNIVNNSPTFQYAYVKDNINFEEYSKEFKSFNNSKDLTKHKESVNIYLNNLNNDFDLEDRNNVIKIIHTTENQNQDSEYSNNLSDTKLSFLNIKQKNNKEISSLVKKSSFLNRKFLNPGYKGIKDSISKEKGNNKIKNLNKNNLKHKKMLNKYRFIKNISHFSGMNQESFTNYILRSNKDKKLSYKQSNYVNLDKIKNVLAYNSKMSKKYQADIKLTEKDIDINHEIGKFN